MSIYIGEGSSGKQQVHLTNSNFSETTMRGGPREGTTFHTDLTYFTVLDTIRSDEGSSRRNLAKSYMDQGYVFKRVYKSYVRGGSSNFPGSTAIFKSSVGVANPNDSVTSFVTWTQVNPSRGWWYGAADEGPNQWGPANGPQSTDGAYLVVDGINYYFNYYVGYSGGYITGGTNNNVELKSSHVGRYAEGVATIRGTCIEYDEMNSAYGGYNPWTGPKTQGARRDYLIFNVRKNGDSYAYSNQNNDPGSAGIWITKDDLTVGNNYSMRNTAILADLGGSGGSVYWNTSQNEYYLQVPYMRSNWPMSNSPLWDFLSEVYKVGIPYTPEMDKVSHLLYDFWIYVDDSNIIRGWQAHPGDQSCIVNINPAGLLGVDSGIKITDDTITMEGTSGRSLTIASPATELLQLPADPVVVTGQGVWDSTYSTIRSGMSAIYTYTGQINTWVNRGAPQTLYGKKEIVGTVDFPPSLKGEVDTARVMIDFKWGSGLLAVSNGGYASVHTVDHKVIHSPMTIFRLFRTPGVVSEVARLASNYFLTSEINTYSVGASEQPTNDPGNKLEGVYCGYSLHCDWDNERFIIYRDWEGQSGNYYWSYYSYNQTIYSRVYAYANGECRYYVPECKVSVYVLSAVDNDYTITPKP